MAAPHMSGIIHWLRMLARSHGEARPDRELIGQFVRDGDQAAFTLLVQRHGPMVYAVCARLLDQGADAEDAFQATFLVLARKAAAIRHQASISGWLHGVARRVAGNLRRKNARQQRRQLPLTSDVPAPEADAAWSDLRGVIDEELARLPDRLRVPLILCYLDGKTREQAAQELGLSEPALRGRLDRGRERLRILLTKRGWTLPAGALATMLAEQASAGPVSGELVRSTVQAALAYISGTALSIKAAALAEGVLQMMWLSKLKTACVVMLALLVTTGGVGWALHAALAGGPGVPVQKADAKAEIAALKAEVAKLRAELDATKKEIDQLKRGRPAPARKEPLFQGKPASYWREQLDDTDVKFRLRAIEAIGALAQKDRSLGQVLLATLKDDPSDDVVVVASRSLGAEFVRQLTEIAEGKLSVWRRLSAIRRIGMLGDAGKPAVPVLMKLLSDPDLAIEVSAATALGRLRASEAAPSLVKALGIALRDFDRNDKDGSRFGSNPIYLNWACLNALRAIDPVPYQDGKKEGFPDGALRISGGTRASNERRAAWTAVYAAYQKKYGR